jgi:diamine N-acetyltransferase
VEIVKLRPIELKDAPFMLERMKDPAVNRFFRFDPEKINMESVTAFINEADSNAIHLAVTNKDDEYLGTISLKNIDRAAKSAEYAVALRASAQNHGIGWKATAEILNLAFGKLGLERVYLNVLSDNATAIRFYDKLGFTCVNDSDEYILIRGETRTLKWYHILKNEWIHGRQNDKRGSL